MGMPVTTVPESLLSGIRSRFFLHLVELFNDYVLGKLDLPQTRGEILQDMPYHGVSYFLLPDDLHQLLAKRLHGVVPFDRSFWQRNQLSGDDLQDERNLSCLRLIVIALRSHQFLQLDHDDQTLMLLPVRLRYNMMTNRYSLVAQTDDGVFIRKHLHDLIGLRQGRPLTKKQWTTAQQAYADYCQSHRAYFHLQLTDVRNGRERCYASFAAFDKKSYRAHDGSYQLMIAYYTFDEADIVNRILALGPAVIVLPDQPDDDEKRHRDFR